jgi:ATP-binding cassette subfamily B protein
MLIMNFTTLAILWFCGKEISLGRMELGDMMAFSQYAAQILFSFVMVAIMFVMIPRVQASAERINQVLETHPEILDPALPRCPADPKGYVQFDQVSFYYPGAGMPAVTDLTFTAAPGKTTAVVGGAGSGKSTLVNLILRFYDVESGRILIDGMDIRRMSQAYLRANIGFVPQSAMLFSGTVSENIRLGKADASTSEIRQAADTAQATEFICQMPEGFESLIAQGGANLSGGQKQRLSIARALVRKPAIYIFDDSFSALDFKTDALLRSALKKETQAATLIIVAQRISTVIDADQIIVLDEGRIVGMGAHQTLLDTCAIYREIVSSQLSKGDMAL